MANRGAYRGIFSSLHDDPDFQQLSSDARLTFLVCRTSKETGPASIFRYYEALLMVQTGLSQKALQRALHDLEEGHWIERDAAVLWVRNGLRYDPNVRLGDPKHRKAVERAISELPKSKVVLNFCDYYEIARPYEGSFKTNPDLALREGVPKKTEKDTDTTAPPTWPSLELLMHLYNEIAPDECRAAEVLNSERRKKAARYLRDFPEQEFWRQTFAEIRQSRFLRGLVPPSGGRGKPFVADFDWFLTKGQDGSENCVKVYEGRYRD